MSFHRRKNERSFLDQRIQRRAVGKTPQVRLEQMEAAQNHMVGRMEVGHPAVPVRISRRLGSPLLELDDMATVHGHSRMARPDHRGGNTPLLRHRNSTARSEDALPAVG